MISAEDLKMDVNPFVQTKNESVPTPEGATPDPTGTQPIRTEDSPPAGEAADPLAMTWKPAEIPGDAPPVSDISVLQKPQETITTPPKETITNGDAAGLPSDSMSDISTPSAEALAAEKETENATADISSVSSSDNGENSNESTAANRPSDTAAASENISHESPAASPSPLPEAPIQEIEEHHDTKTSFDTLEKIKERVATAAAPTPKPSPESTPPTDTAAASENTEPTSPAEKPLTPTPETEKILSGLLEQINSLRKIVDEQEKQIKELREESERLIEASKQVAEEGDQLEDSKKTNEQIISDLQKVVGRFSPSPSEKAAA